MTLKKIQGISGDFWGFYGSMFTVSRYVLRNLISVQLTSICEPTVEMVQYTQWASSKPTSGGELVGSMV